MLNLISDAVQLVQILLFCPPRRFHKAAACSYVLIQMLVKQHNPFSMKYGHRFIFYYLFI